jgi:hypothetical protein
MTLKTWSLIVIALCTVQMMVVYVVTRLNQTFFEGRPAAAYSSAIADLAKKKPGAALTIRVCYALGVVEILGLAVAKYASGG